MLCKYDSVQYYNTSYSQFCWLWYESTVLSLLSIALQCPSINVLSYKIFDMLCVFQCRSIAVISEELQIKENLSTMCISLLNAKKRVWLYGRNWCLFSFAVTFIRFVFYLLSRPHMSSCTLLLCQSGSGSHHNLRTRTVRRRWPAGHSTIGCYSPDKGPDPGAAHNGGPEAQPLNIDAIKKIF